MNKLKLVNSFLVFLAFSLNNNLVMFSLNATEDVDVSLIGAGVSALALAIARIGLESSSFGGQLGHYKKRAEDLRKDHSEYKKKGDFNPEVSKSVEKLISTYEKMAIEGPTPQNLQELTSRTNEMRELANQIKTQKSLVQKPLPATPSQTLTAKSTIKSLSSIEAEALRQQEQLLKKLETARIESQSIEKMQQERMELNKKLQEVEANRIAAETKARESLQTQKTTQQLEYDKAQEIQKLNQQAEELAAKKAQLEAERQRRIQIFSDNMRLKPFKAKLQAWAQRARERVASGQKFVRK